jgi:hypothetical protein
LGQPRRYGVAIVAVVVTTLVILSAVRVLPAPASAPPLTVRNPATWRVLVDIGGADGGGRTLVGTVDRGENRTFPGVPDRWSRLTIRFTYAGVSVEQQYDRDQLDAAGRTVDVPPELGNRLREAGIGETPSTG